MQPDQANRGIFLKRVVSAAGPFLLGLLHPDPGMFKQRQGGLTTGTSSSGPLVTAQPGLLSPFPALLRGHDDDLETEETPAGRSLGKWWSSMGPGLTGSGWDLWGDGLPLWGRSPGTAHPLQPKGP